MKNRAGQPIELERMPTVESQQSEEVPKKPGYCKRLFANKALLVDVVSRILFPAVFAVFNAYYWVTYYLPRTKMEMPPDA